MSVVTLSANPAATDCIITTELSVLNVTLPLLSSLLAFFPKIWPLSVDNQAETCALVIIRSTRLFARNKMYSSASNASCKMGTKITKWTAFTMYQFYSCRVIKSIWGFGTRKCKK